MSFPWAEEYNPKSPLMRWIDERLPLPRLVFGAVGGGYPVPRNLNHFWNFGVLAGVALVIQIVTGIILAMHYAPAGALAFESVEHIMRNVNQGWLLRYAHANGASFFFIVTYIHIFRGLYYGSYKAPREVVWFLGLVIFLLMMATAFMGYVLPWGQMSFWGAKVITGLFGAIPLVGEPVQQWLLGGFAPDNAALNRFFSLHYLLPFVIAWAKPVPVLQSNLRNPRVHSLYVALAGPATNFALAGFAIGAFQLFRPERDTWPWLLLAIFTIVNVILGIYNLLPIPPLDGSAVIEFMLPRSKLHWWYRIRPYTIFGLLAIMLLARGWLEPMFDWAVDLWNSQQ